MNEASSVPARQLKYPGENKMTTKCIITIKNSTLKPNICN